MALFGLGKKKEQSSPQNMPQDQGMYPNQPYPPEQGYGDYGEYSQDPSQYPQAPYPQQQYPQQDDQQFQQAPQQEQDFDKEKIEEVAEAIVEEKWKEKEKEFNKIMEWKEDITTKIVQLQQQMEDLRSSFDSLHKGMLGKITEYDDNLVNVGTEIKAMEKVFSKVLPSLTDSVNKLDRFANSGIKKK